MSQSALTTEPTRHLEALHSQIEALLDSDQLLPAEGRALLEMLQQAQGRIAAGNMAEASGLLLGFETLLSALLDTGGLDPTASHLCIAAHDTAVSLSQTSD